MIHLRNFSFWYWIGIALLAIGIPSSNFLMSISQIILLLVWLLEGNYKQKLINFYNNKAAMLSASVFLMHLFGLIYTSDFSYAAGDLRIKLPLLILPLILAEFENKKIETKNIYIILYLFTGSVISMSVYGFAIYMDVYSNENARSLTPYISHIRFALCICMSIGILFWGIWKQIINKRWFKVVSAGLIFWLIYFLIIMEAITGLGILLILSWLGFIYLFISMKKHLLALMSLFIIILPPIYLYQSYQKNFTVPEINLDQLEEFTVNGNKYLHKINNTEIENGHRVWLYVSHVELKKKWEQLSNIPYDSLDNTGQVLRFTLIRFLASKGLRKDSAGMLALSNQEIEAIENGVANIKYINKTSLTARLHKILWELHSYANYGDPNNHSLLLKIEYQKTALSLIKENFWIGVGTGDIFDAFAKHYKKESRLESNFWYLSHNQFLTFSVAFGILGLLWFVFTLFYPIFVTKPPFLLICFMIIVVLSMLTEDTLETQAGVTFFAFFNSFFRNKYL